MTVSSCTPFLSHVWWLVPVSPQLWLVWNRLKCFCFELNFNETVLVDLKKKKKNFFKTSFVLMHTKHHDNGRCSISFKHNWGLNPKTTWTPSFAALQALAFPSGNANRENTILMICLYLQCGALLLGFRIMLIQNVTLVYCTICAHSVRPDIWIQIYITVISYTIFLTELLRNPRKKREKNWRMISKRARTFGKRKAVTGGIYEMW